jgi:peptidoglycan hydrolase-like protein with peptidoglycan-binding domain
MLFLAACGSTPQDRAISGGGIGAAGGAIIGAVTGLTVLQGALIGTGVGAALGGLTSADKFNLGEPFWKQSGGKGTSGTSARASNYSETVANIQGDLTRLGYNPGPVDGIMGPKTRAAIARFENDQSRKVGTRTVAPTTDSEKMASTTN